MTHGPESYLQHIISSQWTFVAHCLNIPWNVINLQAGRIVPISDSYLHDLVWPWTWSNTTRHCHGKVQLLMLPNENGGAINTIKISLLSLLNKMHLRFSESQNKDIPCAVFESRHAPVCYNVFPNPEHCVCYIQIWKVIGVLMHFLNLLYITVKTTEI